VKEDESSKRSTGERWRTADGMRARGRRVPHEVKKANAGAVQALKEHRRQSAQLPARLFYDRHLRDEDEVEIKKFVEQATEIRKRQAGRASHPAFTEMPTVGQNASGELVFLRAASHSSRGQVERELTCSQRSSEPIRIHPEQPLPGPPASPSRRA